MTRNTWLTIALVISLAVNLLLIGFALGSKFRSPPTGMPSNPMFGLMRYADTLPKQRREEIFEEVRAFRPERAQFRKMLELQSNLRTEIRRDPLDPVALKAALAAVQKRMQTHQSASHDAFVQLMQALTPAERIMLDDQMQRGLGHRQPRAGAFPPEDSLEEPAPE